MRRVAAFIDFQGTLGGDGIDDILSLEFYPFSIEAIKLLNDHGILAIGITNQSHISKGELTMDDYLLKLRQLKNELKMLTIPGRCSVRWNLFFPVVEFRLPWSSF
jgi:Histidinol phosphatase and related phosphatases